MSPSPLKRPIAHILVSAFLIVASNFATQSIIRDCNGAVLAGDNVTNFLLTALNKTEVGNVEYFGPSALNLARFYGLNHRVLDDKTQNVLLANLNAAQLKKERQTSVLETLPCSILIRHSGSNGITVKDAKWTYGKMFPARINAWLKTNTHGMISDNQIDQYNFGDAYHIKTDHVWATSSYANLKWKAPFSISETQPENFFLEKSWSELDPPGKEQTMHCHGRFDFFSDDAMKAVKLPCEKASSTGSFNVILVIPAKGPETLKYLKSSLSEWNISKWQKWLDSFRPVLLDLAVPKLHCNYRMRAGDLAKLEHIVPSQGKCSLTNVTAMHSAILDERGFRFAEGDEYYFTRDQSQRSIPTASYPHPNRNSPPGLTYFSYHDKPGMVIDQPFLVLVFDKKTNALVYATIGK